MDVFGSRMAHLTTRMDWDCFCVDSRALGVQDLGLGL